MYNFNKLVAEFIGTFTLVLGILSAALVSFSALGGGVGILGVSIAAGLTVVAMAYALGPISGAHFNPAVTLGLYAAGRFEARNIIPYIIAQLLGGLFAALVLYVMLSSRGNFAPGNFAANGYGEFSPDKYPLLACALAELILTFLFVLVICRVTRSNGAGALAPLAIGLTLALVHIMSIPISNTSVNPVRATAPAIFADTGIIKQLWLFWLAPLIGGIVAGFVDKAWGDRA
jgi:aquaporin Z